jgi:hypothetical protein
VGRNEERIKRRVGMKKIYIERKVVKEKMKHVEKK